MWASNGRLPLGTGIALSAAYQFHLVHEGGQLHASGPVRDSWAIGPGLIIEPTLWFFDRTTVEGYVLFSRHVPDRSHLASSLHGQGVFARAAGEKNGWRGHIIFWGACDWIKEEGDENYGSLREDGTRFRNTRHYGEVGLTKIFYPAEGVEAGRIGAGAPDREGLQLLVPRARPRGFRFPRVGAAVGVARATGHRARLIEHVEEVAELQNHAPPGAGRYGAADPFGLVVDEEQAGIGILEPADAEVDGPEVSAVVVLH